MNMLAALRPSLIVWTLIVALPCTAGTTRAQDAVKTDGGQCQLCGASCCASTLCSRWISVPMCVTETRYQSHVVKDIVDREETYTVFRRVPVERQYFREEFYLEDEIKTKTITETQCHLVDNPVERTVKVPVPEIHYRESCCGQDGCKACGTCQGDEPRVCPVIVLGEQEIKETCEQPDLVFSKTTKEIDYCVKVPKVKKTLCTTETVYKLEPVEKTRTVSVCVPRLVKTPYEVTVSKMVPQLVTCCEHCARRIDREAQRSESPQRERAAERAENRGQALEKLREHFEERERERGQLLEKMREHVEAFKEKDRALLGQHR
jgi:hypothetical protein